ncbi:COR domain-containing protein [Streptomyces sp. NBC_00828]|uniref:COR domain-containing protein n=1 Tax=Streptomyces sp. NBC_00828 TaxID=2903678 RepID=UPI00386676ED
MDSAADTEQALALIRECRRSGAKSLDLAGLDLTELPEELGCLTHLTELRLDDNRLRELPEWIGGLAALVMLTADNNSIASLPDAIGALTRLKALSLAQNELVAVPESISRLAQLEDLTLDYNRLTAVPDSLGNLTRLTHLRLYGNRRLTTLPGTLRNLTGLTFLALGHNRLSALFEGFTDLTQLRELWLNHNQLSALPEDFGRLTRLIHLSLGGNSLVELPESLGNLRQLETLGLDDVPLSSPPPEVVSAGAKAIVTFLAETHADPVRQWSSKVVVVGEGRVGKTSLLRALRGENHNPHEDSTHGLTVSALDMPHPHPPAGEAVTMRLSTWDFGGQEIYHATHQFFLTDRSLFLLLWDAQIGWEGSKLHYWLDMIKARAPQAPVVLVATHLGPRPPDLPLDELQETYPGLIVASLSADSSTGVGVAEVREFIRRQVAGLPLMGVTWPRTWLRAADAVRAAEAKHITPEGLNELLSTSGVREPSHQASLTAALHSLGDLLYYPNDEELCDLVVLRPQWLTTYISRVLDSEEVLNEGGLFSHSFGNTLWRDVERSMRQHLIRMMENFDLSYRTEDRRASLVVELLPWNPPPYQDEWNSPERTRQRELRLRYRLHTVPPGIPTWFIAREHRFSTPIRWRSGALLKHPDGVHTALVTVDRHAKTAELRVRGSYPHDFFAVLKDGFEHTLQRYPGLDITRLVPCPHRDADGTSCSHEFRHEQLLARLAHNPPRETIECPEHLEDVEVSFLLQGIERPAADLSEQLNRQVLEKLGELAIIGQRQHAEVRGGIEQTRAEVSAMVAEQQRGFLGALRREQSEQEVICPSLVWVRRVSRREAGHRLLPGDVFQLHLCCEAPGEWHLLDGVDPYEVPANSEFTETVLPYVHQTLKFLKYVVPVFGAAIGAASEDLSKVMKDDLEVMKALLDGLPEETRGRLRDREAQSMFRAADHSEYRQMYALLKQLDPEEVWGRLNKVTTPEGPTYWLCREHARFYQQGVLAVGTGHEPAVLPLQAGSVLPLPQGN